MVIVMLLNYGTMHHGSLSLSLSACVVVSSLKAKGWKKISREYLALDSKLTE